MKQHVIRWLAAALALSAACMTGGCRQGAEVGGELTEVTTTGEYPMDTDAELRWWLALPLQVSAYGSSYNDSDFARYLEEATGVKIKFEHPVAGEGEAALNIMISSGDMPDIVEYNWNSYMGGPDRAINDGIIISIDSYMDKVLPNLKKIYDETPEWAKQAKSAEGHYYSFPMINESEELDSYVAMFVRQDLLDKAGLEQPETLEEWNNVLYTFKEMGIKTPLRISLDTYWQAEVTPFGNPFDYIGTFYHDKDGNVKFGPYEKDKFTPWVEQMAKWYEDGIIDKEFLDNDNKRYTAMVANGENGAIMGSIGGDFGGFLSAIPEGSGIKYTAVGVPTKVKGEIGNWWQKSFDVDATAPASISADSKNKEIAARVLDFGYSDAGYMLYNFGKEGVSYEIKDGVPTYTDLITNPDKNGNLTISQAISKNARASFWGPFVRSVDYIHQFYSTAEQTDALKKTASNAFDYKYPNISLEEKDAKRYNDIITAVDTYRAETISQIIAGKKPLEDMAEYYEQLKALGIEEAIELKQKAYDKYIAAID